MNAGAVVRNLDDDVAALLVGAKAERAFRIFAIGSADLRRLDAVIERVADRRGSEDP